MTKYVCHCCGYSELDEEPWGEDGNTPSFGICTCCGIEFGYEDMSPDRNFRETTKLYRQEWISKGAKWLVKDLEPQGWDLKKQLLKINVNL